MFLDYPERPRAPPPASVQLSGLEQEPLLLPWDLRLTPEQFERVCQANPESLLELAADGAVIAMTPTGGETGSRNSRLLIQLGMALSRGQPSLRIFDSSTGFLLPDGSVLRPDLVIELASTSDEGRRGVAALRRKMDLYQANGVRLGWLLLPHEQAVEIWRCGQLGMGERLENASRLDGSELAEGLGLDLEEIWVV
jgi:Uma2 family endonuclease